MPNYCSFATGMVKDASGDSHYEHCNEPATHVVPDSIYDEGYYLCDEHAGYGKYQKWNVQEIKE